MAMLQIFTGDCRAILPALPATSVQCCVTSPPYWGLRDYGTAQWEGGNANCQHIDKLNLKRDNPGGGLSVSLDTTRGNQTSTTSSVIQFRNVCLLCGARRIDSQLGLESTPEEYVTKMVAVFREVWRVLRDDGTLWLNMGDSYSSDTKGSGGTGNSGLCRDGRSEIARLSVCEKAQKRQRHDLIKVDSGLKPKDLCMMPARLAMALQADGWYLRSDIIWHKPNPMPESVTDRPTKAHEYIFLLAKNGGKSLIWKSLAGEWSYDPDLDDVDPDGNPFWKGFDYYYEADAIREAAQNRECTFEREVPITAYAGSPQSYSKGRSGYGNHPSGRNKRSVWTVATQPYAEAHFATFPEDLIKPCIMAGSRIGDTVLDPFAGSGTTGKVAIELGRKAILIELNPDYIALANERTFVTPGFL